MDLKHKLKTLAQLAAIIAIALALKYHYSTASVNDLRWILAPTTFLVEWVTGRYFEFESHMGYMSDDHTFLIAVSCSGVNFLIIAFVMLSLGRLWRERELNWRHIPASLFVAFLATIVANTARITLAMYLKNLDVAGLDAEELHRLEGISVYFGFLLLLFVASERFARREAMTTAGFARRSLLPLAIYYAATLGVPIAGGAFREDGFWYHSLFVFVMPLVLVSIFFLPGLCRGASAKLMADRHLSRRSLARIHFHPGEIPSNPPAR